MERSRAAVDSPGLVPPDLPLPPSPGRDFGHEESSNSPPLLLPPPESHQQKEEKAGEKGERKEERDADEEEEEDQPDEALLCGVSEEEEEEEVVVVGKKKEKERTGSSWGAMVTGFEHTFLENVVFYLFLGSVPGWLQHFFSEVLFFLFPALDLDDKLSSNLRLLGGGLCFVLSIKLFGVFLGRGALTDPCAAFLRLKFLSSLSQMKQEEEKESEEEKSKEELDSETEKKEKGNTSSTQEAAERDSVSFSAVLLRISLASLSGAVFVGLLYRLSLSGRRPQSSSSSSFLASRIYEESQKISKHEGRERPLSSLHLPLSRFQVREASFFLPFFSLLPAILQISLARLATFFLFAFCRVLLLLQSLYLSSLSLLLSSSASVLQSAHPAFFEDFLQPLLFSCSSSSSLFFGGLKGDGGFVDVVLNRLGASRSKSIDLETLLWLSGIFHVFLGECVFSCFNYMVQALDFLANEIILTSQEEKTDNNEKNKEKKKKKKILSIRGSGDLSLVLGFMIYMAGSPYCAHTGGPVLNASYAAMSFVSRLDFFGFTVVFLADFLGAFLATLLVRPLRIAPLLKKEKVFASLVSTDCATARSLGRKQKEEEEEEKERKTFSLSSFLGSTQKTKKE